MTFIRSVAAVADPLVISNGKIPPIGSQESAGWAFPTPDVADNYIAGGGVLKSLTKAGTGTLNYGTAYGINGYDRLPRQGIYAGAGVSHYCYAANNGITRQTGFSALWFGACTPNSGGSCRVFCGFSSNGPGGVLASSSPVLSTGYYGWWVDRSVAENNWYVIHAGNSAAPTKIDTGLATNNGSGPLPYWFEIKTISNGNIDFKVYDRTDLTNLLFSTSVSTNIPTNVASTTLGWGITSLDANANHGIFTSCHRLNFVAAA